mgnify:CR=1 FL=1
MTGPTMVRDAEFHHAEELSGATGLREWLAADPGGQRQMAVQCGILSVVPDCVTVPAKVRYRLAGRLAKATAVLALYYLRAAREVGGIPYEPHGGCGSG